MAETRHNAKCCALTIYKKRLHFPVINVNHAPSDHLTLSGPPCLVLVEQLDEDLCSETCSLSHYCLALTNWRPCRANLAAFLSCGTWRFASCGKHEKILQAQHLIVSRCFWLYAKEQYGGRSSSNSEWQAEKEKSSSKANQVFSTRTT